MWRQGFGEPHLMAGTAGPQKPGNSLEREKGLPLSEALGQVSELWAISRGYSRLRVTPPTASFAHRGDRLSGLTCVQAHTPRRPESHNCLVKSVPPGSADLGNQAQRR